MRFLAAKIALPLTDESASDVGLLQIIAQAGRLRPLLDYLLTLHTLTRYTLAWYNREQFVITKSELQMSAWRKVLLSAGGLIAAVLLGAIGSGLWERVLSKCWDSAVRLFVSAMSAIWAGYSNGIYLEAAKGLHDYPSLAVYSWFFIMLPMLFAVTLLLMHPYRLQKTDVPSAVVSKTVDSLWCSRRGFQMAILMVCLLFALYWPDVIRTCYVDKVVTYSQQSLLIVAPFIDDHQAKELQSSFCSMKTADDFNRLRVRLQDIARRNHVELPHFVVSQSPRSTHKQIR
jgi:hypothetical protein